MPQRSFRTKLAAIFGAALISLVSVLVVSVAVGARQNRQLDDVQRRLVPKSELGPRVEAEFERMTRGMQDAVAAQDASALSATIEHRATLFALINGAGAAIEPPAAASLRWAIQDYYQVALAVSERLIAGESNELLLQDVMRMQAQQRKVQEVIKKTTSLDHGELAAAFVGLHRESERADAVRFGIAGVGILAVALLAFWGGGGVLQALNELSRGLARFGTGDFSTPIPIGRRDELAAVAEQANQMAESLSRHSKMREREDWIKAGLVALNDQLRGELEPRTLAEQTLSFLVERVGALAGALYVRDDTGDLVLEAAHAGGKAAREAGVGDRFGEREGLVGQALASGELALIDDLPANYLKLRSGLGEARPEQLLLLPLVHAGRKAGVLELALLKPAREEVREFLLATRAPVAIAVEAARSGAARRGLLQETQAQAERLMAQEEELRVSNDELSAQQEELRLANQELERQRLALAQHNQELSRARQVLADKAEELNRVSAYKSQFLANMSHELRTPLNSMLLLSQLLSENEQGNITPKQVEYLRTIHSAGQDLLALINQVLDLSKIEAGKQDIALEWVETSALTAFARRMFEASATHKGLSLVTRLEEGTPSTLFTDRQRVERILLNLLGNALKFTERGSLSLVIGRPRGALSDVIAEPAIALTVSDTGRGIPEAARERVFAPFEQVQGEANRAHAGTGLGLSIARESARLLGGELLLESSSKEGSRFVCVLPERARASSAPTDVAGSALPSPVPEAPSRPYLLVIEDDAVLAEQLVETARARGLEAVVVSSGRAGLQLARLGNVLGIILDVKLPDLDGWSVMERLKRDELTRSIPVHFVSGTDAPHRGLALGAVGYLVKPASHSDLASMVRALVPSKAAPAGILLVEDDPAQGASIVTVLRQDGFEPRHVQTAAAALEALRSGAYGCLILDLGLPDMDGLRLLETLRAQPGLGAPRVIIHTGRALSKQETRELEAYAEAVVLKDGSSPERLLEEARLFVRHVTKRLPARQSLEPARNDASFKGVKVLLAEDDMRTVYSLSALLRSKGAEVITAETGREALEALGRHPDIQAVLMDVMMPEVDGYEAMRKLRQDPRFVKVPVIALTAKAMKGERERCLESGASDYLPKPVDNEALLATLRTWVGPGGA